MPDLVITTLTAERGKKYDKTGDLVAFYGRSIVFLQDCPGVSLGQDVRVELHPQGEDRAGKTMYRATPAPDEIIERWRENADDGTVNHVKIAKNWLLQESEIEVLEKRQRGTRDGTPDIRRERKAVLASSSQEDSYIEELRTKMIPIEAEYVYNGTLLWKEVSMREEPAGGDLYPVETIEAIDRDWELHRLDPHYEATQKIALLLSFLVKGTRQTLRWETVWRALPDWLHRQLEAPYPLCVCGRQRLDTPHISDGYGKCEICREEERCARCRRDHRKVVLQRSGDFLCDECQPYEEAEELIHQLPSDRLKAIGEEASKLLGGTVLAQETGEVILRATTDHISSEYSRNQLLRKWSGYLWYYFCDHGIFGTKFAREALEILQYLPQARGNRLVELIGWLSEKSLPSSSDYYLCTQVKHEQATLPMQSVKEIVRKLAEGKIHLADRLRASEGDRVAAVTAYRKAEEELPSEALAEARTVLQEEAQDYKKVLSLLKAAYEEQARQKRIDELLACEYATCPVCGEQIDWTFAHCCPEQDALCAIGNFQPFMLKVSRSGGTEIAKLEATYNEGEYALRLVLNPSAAESDSVETELNWHLPSLLEEELVKKIRECKLQLSAIEYERGRAGRIELVFTNGTNPKGKPQLQCETLFTGQIRDDRAKQGYKLLEDCKVLFTAWADSGPLEGEVWICTVGRQIGTTKNQVPIVTANPQVKANEQEIRDEISSLERTLEAERKRRSNTYVDQPFDKEGNATTALAEKLRNAGLI